MKIRKTLVAEDGKWITDGKQYWRQFTLALDDNEYYYHEVTDAEKEEAERFEQSKLDGTF